MYYYNETTHELKDNEIMNALDDCITSYEDG